MPQAKLTIGELEAGYPVLQGLETTPATGKIKLGYRAHGLLGAPGNPESLSSNPVQIPSYLMA